MRMGKWLSAIALGTLLMAPMAEADDVVAVPSTSSSGLNLQHHQDITINPLSMIFGLFSAQYERRISPSGSWALGASYWGLSVASYEFTSIGVNGAYRFWPGSHALEGFYVGPIAAFDSASATVTEPFSGQKGEASAALFSLGGLVGYQWVWDGGFLIDLAIGVQDVFGTLEGKAGNTTVKVDVTGVGFAGRFALGYAWH